MPTTINGTGITFPNGTTQTTAASGAGTVTSVATGNGLQGGTITTSGTLSVACPTGGSVGSYALLTTSVEMNANTNYTGGNFTYAFVGANPPGTWKIMAHAAYGIVGGTTVVACRVA